MGQYTTITFGGVTLHVTNLTPLRNASAVRQKLGKDVATIQVLGRLVQDWELQLSGIVFGTTATNLSTNRASLETPDDADAHAFVDGIHNGTYIMEPGSLQFSDSGDDARTVFKYQAKLVQKQ